MSWAKRAKKAELGRISKAPDGGTWRHLAAMGAREGPYERRRLVRARPMGAPRRGCVIFEVAGTCELQGIDGRSFYAKREDLNNTETWERLP